MINHPAFSVEPWCLRCTGFDLEVLAQTESLFALSNGHIGWRGNLDEGEPHGLPGSYLNGVHERRTLSYVEPGYGYPESGQVVTNVTNGKLIRQGQSRTPQCGRPRRRHAVARHDYQGGNQQAQECALRLSGPVGAEPVLYRAVHPMPGSAHRLTKQAPLLGDSLTLMAAPCSLAISHDQQIGGEPFSNNLTICSSDHPSCLRASR